MLNALRKLTAAVRSATPPAGRIPARFAPQLEALHDRVMPSVYVVGGHLIIYGTAGRDVVSVVADDDNYTITETRPDSYYPSPKMTTVPLWRIYGQISFTGYEGDDSFTNGTALQSFANGGAGNDTLVGGSSQDQLTGEVGHDRLVGHGGADVLTGGDGDDRLYAAGDRTGDAADPSDNTLDGGNGNDDLYGSEGNDELRGGAGADLLSARGGHDLLSGGTGRDYLYGGEGDDILDGGVDDGSQDYLHGGAGADRFKFDPEDERHGYIPLNPVWWFPLTVNLDEPVDFNRAEDTVFGTP
jgi:Ca2+-binding RTX toxin-like protein